MLPDLTRPPPPVPAAAPAPARQPAPLTDQERQTYILQLKAAAMLTGKGRRTPRAEETGIIQRS